MKTYYFQIPLIFSRKVPAQILTRLLVTNTAENILTTIPMLRVRANPLTKLVPNVKSIIATRSVVKLLSLIEGQALENPSLTDSPKVLLDCNSSFILGKIRILASTAIPIDSINPPIPAKVNVTGINLNKAKTIAT